MKRTTQYKHTGPRDVAWQSAFREKCVKELQERRQARLMQRRGITSSIEASSASASAMDMETSNTNAEDVYTVMRQEYERMRADFPDLPEWPVAAEPNSNLLYNLNIGVEESSILQTMAEIEQELRQHQAEIAANEFQDLEDFEEQAARHAEMAAQETTTLCPCCHQCPLYLHGQVLTCACGVHVDLMSDHLSMDSIQQSVSNAYSLHTHQCSLTPQCQVNNIAGIETLVMLCRTCDFYEVLF